MDVSAVQSQVQISVMKMAMNNEVTKYQTLLQGMPQPAQSIPEPGKGQNVDLRV